MKFEYVEALDVQFSAVQIFGNSDALTSRYDFFGKSAGSRKGNMEDQDLGFKY